MDEKDRVLRQKTLANKLELFVAELEPFRATLQGVAVESTFNWLKHGSSMKLVNTAAIQQCAGLKHTDDPYDAWWLSHTPRLGIPPTGYIYPREERAVRDLLRKRSSPAGYRFPSLDSLLNGFERTRSEFSAAGAAHLIPGQCRSSAGVRNMRRTRS
jgi:hypothetical protein